MKRLLSSLARYFVPGVVGLTPSPVDSSFDGAVMNTGSLISLLNQLRDNGAPQTGQWNYVTDATGTGTWSAAVVPPGIASTVLLQSGQAAITKTTATASLIIGQIPGAYIGQTALFVVANTNSGTLTVAAGTNVTLAGTTTVLTVSVRLYQIKITNLANPDAVGAVATNTTTTTAAVASSATTGVFTSVVIPVTSATGIIVGSVLQVTQTDGTLFTGTVSAVNTLDITVLGANDVAIASGAAVSVFNNTLTLTGMFTVAANVAA